MRYFLKAGGNLATNVSRFTGVLFLFTLCYDVTCYVKAHRDTNKIILITALT